MSWKVLFCLCLSLSSSDTLRTAWNIIKNTRFKTYVPYKQMSTLENNWNQTPNKLKPISVCAFRPRVEYVCRTAPLCIHADSQAQRHSLSVSSYWHVRSCDPVPVILNFKNPHNVHMKISGNTTFRPHIDSQYKYRTQTFSWTCHRRLHWLHVVIITEGGWTRGACFLYLLVRKKLQYVHEGPAHLIGWVMKIVAELAFNSQQALWCSPSLTGRLSKCITE